MNDGERAPRIYADNSANEKQFLTMTQTPIPALISRLAVPTVISMLVSSLYNMADTFFVSRIGTSAGAAVGIVFSVMAIIQAAGFTLGMGTGSLLSRLLGKKDINAANRIVSIGFFTAFFFGLCVSIPGLVFIERLMVFLGASPTILPYAKSYASCILVGAPLMSASFVLNNILRAEGKAAFSMIGLTTGGILNIALDPLFIFKFGLGTIGAGAATLISQAISFCILLQFFLRKKSVSRISLFNIPFAATTFFSIAKIISTGFPSLCRQGLASVSTMMLNRRAALYGDAVVAGFSIVLRITMLISSIMIGIGQGMTPVAGFNYGAGDFKRVRQSYFFTVAAGGFILTALSFFLFIFAPEIIQAFSAQREVVSAGTAVLKWQSIALPLHAVIVTSNMILQATGKIIPATFLSSNRQGTFFIPLVLILPAVFGLPGLEAVQAISDVFSFLAAIPFAAYFLCKLENQRTATAKPTG